MFFIWSNNKFKKKNPFSKKKFNLEKFNLQSIARILIFDLETRKMYFNLSKWKKKKIQVISENIYKIK